MDNPDNEDIFTGTGKKLDAYTAFVMEIRSIKARVTRLEIAVYGVATLIVSGVVMLWIKYKP